MTYPTSPFHGKCALQLHADFFLLDSLPSQSEVAHGHWELS